MLVSKKWLSEFVSLPESVSDQDLAARITGAVVEVESVTRQADAFEHMVVGRVTSVGSHPNADRLRVCVVDVGGRTVSIVCGGSNVIEGMLVAVALPGARVRWHGEGDLIELAKTSIRGEISEGMICAGAEIGLGKPTDQEREIMDLTSSSALPGMPLAEVFKKDDVIFDIEHKSMTHRPDLFGHVGMAREIAALYRVPFHAPQPSKIHAGKSINLSVTIDDETLCPRYMAVALEGITVAPSPAWLASRLEASGIHSINNVVDITNYVLLELGQPMHAFDADQIGGDRIHLRVRCAHDGETMHALDDQIYLLNHEHLLITDGEQAIAIAGVMGGLESAVRTSTTRIVFESANFSAVSIRKTSQTLSLRSESSTRFEKSLDPTLCEVALARAVELVRQLCIDARVSSRVVDSYTIPASPKIISLSPDQVNARLGADISVTDMKDILTRLGFSVSVKRDIFSVTVPSWRATKDIEIAEDLMEEIVRIYGYDRMTSTLPVCEIIPPPTDPVRMLAKQANQVLVQGFGAIEVYSYAFASEQTLSKLGWNVHEHLQLANPLSKERPYLVRSLIPNLLECVQKNQRMQDEVLVFEYDRVFWDEETQPHFFSVTYTAKGNEEPFWHVKQIAQSVLHRLGYEGIFAEVDVPEVWQQMGRTASIVVSGTLVGTISEIDSARAQTFGLDHKTGIMELNLDVLAKQPHSSAVFTPIPLYPSIVRDLAFLISDRVEYATLEQAIKQIHSAIVGVELFDTYRGKGIDPGKKSLGVRVEFRASDRTLESKEVDAWMHEIKKMIENDFSGMMRE